jgi:hypothetical protein
MVTMEHQVLQNILDKEWYPSEKSREAMLKRMVKQSTSTKEAREDIVDGKIIMMPMQNDGDKSMDAGTRSTTRGMLENINTERRTTTHRADTERRHDRFPIDERKKYDTSHENVVENENHARSTCDDHMGSPTIHIKETNACAIHARSAAATSSLESSASRMMYPRVISVDGNPEHGAATMTWRDMRISSDHAMPRTPMNDHETTIEGMSMLAAGRDERSAHEAVVSRQRTMTMTTTSPYSDRLERSLASMMTHDSMAHQPPAVDPGRNHVRDDEIAAVREGDTTRESLHNILHDTVTEFVHGNIEPRSTFVKESHTSDIKTNDVSKSSSGHRRTDVPSSHDRIRIRDTEHPSSFCVPTTMDMDTSAVAAQAKTQQESHLVESEACRPDDATSTSLHARPSKSSSSLSSLRSSRSIDEAHAGLDNAIERNRLREPPRLSCDITIDTHMHLAKRGHGIIKDDIKRSDVVKITRGDMEIENTTRMDTKEDVATAHVLKKRDDHENDGRGDDGDEVEDNEDETKGPQRVTREKTRSSRDRLEYKPNTFLSRTTTMTMPSRVSMHAMHQEMDERRRSAWQRQDEDMSDHRFTSMGYVHPVSRETKNIFSLD